jgi:ribonuclease HIII
MTQNRLDALRAYAEAQGWEWRNGKPIQHGEQIIIASGDQQVTLTYYPRRGKLIPGGPESPLKAALTDWLAQAEPTGASGASPTTPSPAAPRASGSSGGTRLDALKTYVAGQGWNWGPGATIPYGEQIVVTSGAATALVNFWPKRGRMQVQGNASSLKADLQAWVEGGQEPSATAETGKPVAVFTGPHIGMDESGKGDWFGPLVVAAVYVDTRTIPLLRRAGVRDSKELDAAVLPRIAAQIAQIIPPEQRLVWSILPEEYNRLYAQHGNINLLLAAAYAQVAAQLRQALQSATDATAAPADLPIVCDQFSQRADRLEQAFAARQLPRPQQQHHAEAAGIGVAAASILAGDTFTGALADLAGEAGLPNPLPKGASAIAALQATARRIIARQGATALGRYAKLNFKPVRELLERAM